MNNTQMVSRGILNEQQVLLELVAEVDPMIGEASAAIGAITTEIIRRTLRGSVLKVGREISDFVGDSVRQHIVDQQPMIEKTAAIIATEVSRGEVEAVRLAAKEQHKHLAERIDDALRRSEEQSQTIARELAGRIEETSRLANEQTQTVAHDLQMRLEETVRETHQRIEVVARSADDTARQTTETASQLSRTLESEVAAVEMRTLEMARKELIEKIETLREGARSAAGKFVERLDKTDAATAQIAAQQIALKQELIEAMRTERENLIEELKELRRANKSLLKRVDVLEEPRGLWGFFARLFGKKGSRPSARTKRQIAEEREAE